MTIFLHLFKKMVNLTHLPRRGCLFSFTELSEATMSIEISISLDIYSEHAK